MASAGRWSLLPVPSAGADPDELAEAVAEQLVVRWGVVFRDLVARENLAVPWREILWALRRMEARGTIRGGRFVTGFSGEQFAHPDAVDVLRAVRKQRPAGETVQLSAADPLNLTGIVLPGPRIPAIPSNTVTYLDGVVAPGTAWPAGHPERVLDERARAGDGPADDQGIDLAGALVGVDRLGIGHEAADLVLQQDAVAAEQLAGVTDGFPHPHRAERLGQRRVLVAALPAACSWASLRTGRPRP